MFLKVVFLQEHIDDGLSMVFNLMIDFIKCEEYKKDGNDTIEKQIQYSFSGDLEGGG